MGCNGLLFLVTEALFLPLLMVMVTSSSVQRKWYNIPPPPAVICTTCLACENPCNQVPPPPPPKPPQIQCPPPPPPPPKPPQIECPPPPPSPFHYVFPPHGAGYYPYNYPDIYFSGADPSLVHNKFNLLCLIGLVLHIFL